MLYEGGKKMKEVAITAPIPGLVARVVVVEGEQVSKGQTVAVINCMKNEISVSSPYNGKVNKILVKEWDEMDVGYQMITLEVDEVE
jgi:biotin carboxyl carrier protein